MSEGAQIALATGGIGLASLLVTLVARFLERRQEMAARERERSRESEEWRRRSLFEHRIAAIHEANDWMLQLQKSRATVKREMTLEERNRHFALCEEARTWLMRNMLYLYGKVPEGTGFGSFLSWVGFEDDDKAYRDSLRDANIELDALTKDVLSSEASG